MKLAYKIWIDQDGKAFGDGPLGLLKGVEETDSLHQAAIRMGMSYSKAWRLIGAMEKRLGFPLIERTVGGLSGGGSRITPRAKDFMLRYEQFREEVERCLQKAFRRHFGSTKRGIQK
jgi:molybdate transport system regulatory protein